MSPAYPFQRQPSENQKRWFRGLFSHQEWQELCREDEFNEALQNSLGQARMVALRHLARKNVASSE